MNGLLLFSIIISLNVSASYPILVTGEALAVEHLVDILNSESFPDKPVEAQLINEQTKEYGLYLAQRLSEVGYTSRKKRFECALNYLLGDSSKTFKMRVVENSRSILISDGRKGIVDIGDVQKFDSGAGGNLKPFNILLHELYEQYQLQVIEGIKPGKVNTTQLNLAHIKAIRKESNFYSLTAVRTEAHINDDYIHIEFSSVVDTSKTHYYVYYRNGNIDRLVVKQTE